MISEGRLATILALMLHVDKNIDRAIEFSGEPACDTYLKIAKQSCEAAMYHARLLDVSMTAPEATAAATAGEPREET